MVRTFLSLSVFLALAEHAFAQSTWRRTYGGLGSDEGWSIIELPDSSLVFCGSTGSFGEGSSDVYLLKMDDLGDPIWSRTYGSIGVETGRCIKKTDDGGFILAGATNGVGAGGYDGYLLRLDSNGDVIWQHTYGGSDWDQFNSVALVGDSFYVAGSTYSQGDGGSDGWLLKLDDTGGIIWALTLGSVGDDVIHGIRCSNDGGVALAMEWEDDANDVDAVLAKVNAGGDLDWSYTVDGDSTDIGYDVTLTASGYVLCCASSSYTPFSSFLITKIDMGGAFVWQQLYSASESYEPRSIVEGDNGRFAMAGSTRAFGFGGLEGYFMMIDSSGAYLNGTTYGSTEDDYFLGIASCADGGFALCGSSRGPGPGPQAVFVVKTDTIGFTVDETIVPFIDPTSILDLDHMPSVSSLHPNPAASHSIVYFNNPGADRCAIVDMSGRTVLSTPLARGQRTLSLSDVAPGVYSVTFSFKERLLATERLVVQ